jgi:tetratricopeptide (TPR) repeat protein
MRQVIARAPDFGPAWVRLGDAEFKEGRYDRAEEAWRRVISLAEPPPSEPPPGTPAHVSSAPLSAYAGFGLARITLARGDADRAKQILEEVTSSAPRFGPAFRLLSDAYAGLGRTADADRARRRAGRLATSTPFADVMIDALARESRSTTFLLRQAAEADLASNAAWGEYLLRRATTFDPANPDVLYELGTRLHTLGRSSDALEFLQRYHELVPDEAEGPAAIGRTLVGARRFADAEVALREALRIGESADAHYNLGIALTQLGQPKLAMSEYERALAQDPNHLQASNNLAAALAREGRLHEAARLLGTVLGIDSENAEAHTNLGVVFMQQGRREEARHELQEALRIDPQQPQARGALQELGER